MISYLALDRMDIGVNIDDCKKCKHRIACPICNRKKSCKLPEDFTGKQAELIKE